MVARRISGGAITCLLQYSLSVDVSDTVKCKMQILFSGSISLSGHLPVELLLCFIWVFITPGQRHRGFIVQHST